ncbi:MAG: hypothetical protein JST78_12010 [Bacteroidetes bacterium]|nr:hypothetical protein [Bacteroidota bacterium]
MKYSYKILSLFLTLLFVTTTSAQDSDLERSIGGNRGVSNSSSGGSGLNIDTYRGVGNYGIPLYTFQGREMNFPISINYAISGIKVDQTASCVGLGWNLFAGGSINRIVNNQPDGFSILPGGSPPNYVTPSECIYNFGIFDCTEQPSKDFYKVNTIGLDETLQCARWHNTAVPLENERINVNWDVYTDSSDIIITAEDGTVYTFGLDGVESIISSSYGQGGFRDRINKSNYKLTRLVSKNGLDIYTIDYQTFEWSKIIPNNGDGELVISRYNGNGPIANYPDPIYYLNQASYKMIEKLPTAIYHNGVKIISFSYDNRDDMSFVGGTGNKLSSINILKYRSNDIQKKINFDYSYFGPLSANKYTEKRLKLNRISVSGSDNQNNVLEERLFEFGYDRPELVPAIDSYARDYLGFYNGRDENLNLIPDFAHNHVPTYVNIDIFDFNPPNSNRSFNINYATVGILNEIINSSKGKTIIEYEQNELIVPQGVQYADPTTQMVDGFRIASITMQDEQGNFVGKKKYEYLKSRFLDKVVNAYYKNDLAAYWYKVHILTRGYANPNEIIHYKHVLEKTLDSAGNENGYIEYLYEKDAPYGIPGITSVGGISEIAPIYNIGYGDGSINMQKYQYEKFDILTQKLIYNKQGTQIYTENHTYLEDYDWEGYNMLGLLLSDGEGGYYGIDHYFHPENTRKYLVNAQHTIENLETGEYFGSDITYDQYSQMTNKIDLSIDDYISYDYQSYPYLSQITSAKYGKTQLFYNEPNFPHLVTDIKKAKPGDVPETTVLYDYDGVGNKIQTTKYAAGNTTNAGYVSYIYGYDNRFVVAELVGVKFSDIDANLISRIKADTKNPYSEAQDLIIRNLLKTLRDNHPDALVTTYTYNPPVGVVSVTDPKGYTIFNEYDPLGRLQFTKELNPVNGQKYILSENNYHQKPN